MTEIGLTILETVTVKVVPEVTEVPIILVMKTTEFNVAVQVIPELVVPDLVTVAVQPPLAMNKSDGRVIFKAEPDNNGLVIVKVKV